MRERVCTGLLVVSFDDLAHQGGHRVGVQRSAPASREDVAVDGSKPRISKAVPLGGLLLPMVAEDGDCLTVDGYDSGPAALSGAVDPLAADHGGGTGDGDVLVIEVDIFPSKVEQLAAPGSGVGSQMEEGG